MGYQRKYSVYAFMMQICLILMWRLIYTVIAYMFRNMHHQKIDPEKAKKRFNLALLPFVQSQV
jgi:cellulose synthase/poly-beta-1,6-N-acetylglucosamine synthase-like glycosyltransferase